MALAGDALGTAAVQVHGIHAVGRQQLGGLGFSASNAASFHSRPVFFPMTFKEFSRLFDEFR